MANVVEIVIKGQDTSGKAIKEAEDRMKSLGSATKVMNAQMKASGAIISSVGDSFRAFGSVQIAGAISSVEAFVISSRAMQAELGKTKAAMAAIGVAGVALGVSLGGTLYDLIFGIPGKSDATKHLEILDQTLRKIHQLRNPQTAELDQITFDAQDQMREIEKLKISESEKQNAIFRIKELAELRKVRLTEEANAKIVALDKEQEAKEKKIVDDLNAFAEESNKIAQEKVNESRIAYDDLIMSMKESAATETDLSERLLLDRAEVIRRAYQNQLISEQEAATATETAFLIHQEKMTKIQMEQSAKRKAIVEDERKSQLQRLATIFGAGAQLFGSLAQLMETQGKKQFKMAQGLRYAEAVMSTAAGIARAYADHDYFVATVIAAAVAAAGAAQIATIASTKPPQAHGGASYIPEETTYLLNKGERVLSPRQNEDLTAFMESGRGGGSGGDLYIDGAKIGQVLWDMSRAGRLRISSRAIV